MAATTALAAEPAKPVFSAQTPAQSPAEPEASDKKTSSFQTRQIEGWTLHINEQLLANERELAENAVALLTTQLQEIVRTVPGPALAKLREVPLWFSPEYTGISPRAEYHPNVKWLIVNGRSAELAKSVEFTNIRIFAKETKRMQNFVLHELAHGFHDRVLGFDHPEIRAAYERAKAAKLYDAVERTFGDGRPNTTEVAYAMTSPQEYFAETTEAFFSRNDFFPSTHRELRDHDPEMERLLSHLWGMASLPRAEQSDPTIPQSKLD